MHARFHVCDNACTSRQFIDAHAHTHTYTCMTQSKIAPLPAPPFLCLFQQVIINVHKDNLFIHIHTHMHDTIKAYRGIAPLPTSSVASCAGMSPASGKFCSPSMPELSAAPPVYTYACLYICIYKHCTYEHILDICIYTYIHKYIYMYIL